MQIPTDISQPRLLILKTMNENELEYVISPLKEESESVRRTRLRKAYRLSRGMTFCSPKDFSHRDDTTDGKKRRTSSVATRCLHSVAAYYDRLHPGRHDRRRWCTRGVSGMATDCCSQNRRSDESTKNGVTGNVIETIYQMRRSYFNAPVIPTVSPDSVFLSGMEWRDLLKTFEDEKQSIV